MSTKEIVTCDICKCEVAQKARLDASVYGVDAHIECFKNLNSFEVLAFLGIDEIRMGMENTRTHASTMREMGLIP